MSYDDDVVLSDEPTVWVDAGTLPTYELVPYSPDHLFTLERTGTDYVAVVLTTAGVVQCAYMNGVAVEFSHPLVVEITDGWEPPLRWLPTSDTLNGPAAVYERALAPEQIAAHYDAFTGSADA